MKKHNFLLILLICLWQQRAQAQEIKPLKQNLTFNIDNLGDGHIQLSMSFNAAQWDNFKRNMGTNTDQLKRQMERILPAYYLQHFDYKEDAMNRSYTLSFDALGMAKINDDGLWQVDLDMKKPDITKLSDNIYTLTTSYNAQGTLVQQVGKLVIPDGASGIKQGEDTFGKTIFTYSLSPGSGLKNLVTLIGGTALILTGIVVYLYKTLKTPVKTGTAQAMANV